MDKQVFARAALGSTASLGDLYDARKDGFCWMSIFKNSVPESAVTTTDSNYLDLQLVQSDNFAEKAVKLDINGELQVSVLAGLLTLKGSARYLNEKKKSERTVKSFLVCNVKTKDQSLNINHDDLLNLFATDAVEKSNATHVVVGISWGANSILSCVYENKESRDVKEVMGSLSAKLEKAKIAINGEAKVDYDDGDRSIDVKFDFHVFGDILPNDQESVPTTFEKALELMKQVPSLIKMCNAGKGKPVTYHLLPIGMLPSNFSFARGIASNIQSLEDASLVGVVQMFEQVSKAQQKLYDFHQDVYDHSYCVKREDMDVITTFQNQLKIQEASIRMQVSQVLQEIRSGKEKMDKLDNLLREMHTGTYSSTGVVTKITSWSSITEKIRFAQLLERNGATYIGYGKSLEEELLAHFDCKSYVLYFTQTAKEKESTSWKDNRKIFFQEMKKETPGHNFIAIDCDIHPGLKPAKHFSCIQIEQSGKLVVEDLLAEQQQMQQVPLVQFSSGSTVRMLYKPNKTVNLKIPCIGLNCDPTIKYEWTCKKCQSKIEYGFDDHVYCVCGKTPALCMEFRCTNSQHGLVYNKHEDGILRQLLSTLRPFSNLNILILGESGVGKSTWINGFFNYLSYASLEEALAADLISLIPSKFSVYNSEFEEVCVSTGNDDNEVFEVGQSATQTTKVYTFPVGNTNIRLIDTPGIGDVRGVNQDKINFENILATLTQLDEIHGICILLKPNNSKLNVMFRFCIKELLTHLHRDASQNIVFCFTNSRGTFYRPGNTLPALKKLLAENNDVEIPISQQTIYCYDSEAYRFLAAVKNQPPITFSEKEQQNFSESWQKSVDETKRMLKYILNIKPHEITKTLILNHARAMVITLYQPLTEMTRVVENYKHNLEVAKKDLLAWEGKIDEFIKKETVTPQTPVAVELLFESTNIISECMSILLLPITGSRILSKQLVSYLGIGRIRQLPIIVQSKMKDMDDKLSEKEKKDQIIKHFDESIKEHEVELNTLEQASLMFVHFLKTNAITTYNDEMNEYLTHLIREEERKGSSDSQALETLKKSQATYNTQKKLIDEQIKLNAKLGNVHPPGPKDIEQLVRELQQLKHSGCNFKSCLEYFTNSGHVSYKEKMVRPPENSNAITEIFSNSSY